MKTGIKAALRSIVVVASIFAPFLMLLSVLLTHPSGIYLEKNRTDALSWIWLFLLAAVMLGTYYLTVYMSDEAEIGEEFHQLDRDHDGFITVEDAKNWPALRRSFASFDADHDGRLSRFDFDVFEHTKAAR